MQVLETIREWTPTAGIVLAAATFLLDRWLAHLERRRQRFTHALEAIFRTVFYSPTETRRERNDKILRTYVALYINLPDRFPGSSRRCKLLALGLIQRPHVTQRREQTRN